MLRSKTEADHEQSLSADEFLATLGRLVLWFAYRIILTCGRVLPIKREDYRTMQDFARS